MGKKEEVDEFVNSRDWISYLDMRLNKLQKYDSQTFTVEIAEILGLLKRFSEAKVLIEEYLREHPNSINARIVEADILASEGEKERAADFFVQLAEFYMKKDLLAESVFAFERTCALVPEIGLLWGMRALGYALTLRVEDARMAVEKALEFDDHSEELSQTLFDVEGALAVVAEKKDLIFRHGYDA